MRDVLGWLAIRNGTPVTDAYGHAILYDKYEDARLEGQGETRPVVRFSGWGPDTRTAAGRAIQARDASPGC